MLKSRFLFFLTVFILLVLTEKVLANQFFASVDGRMGNTGTISNPWDLQTAFNKTNIILPGDTLWIRGGTYFGSNLVDRNNVSSFVCSLSGTAIKPILIRNYKGERVIIDGGNRPHPVKDSVNNNDSYTLAFVGNYNIVWGLEISNSNTHSRADSLAGFQWRVRSLITLGVGHKFINLIIHDCGNGHGFFSSCVDCEMYGNIIYYNGWSHLGVRGHGEGVYAQNMGSTKFIRDNIVFKQFDSGIILYGSKNAEIENFHVEGNILFDNGQINDNPNGWGFLVGRNTLEKGPCKHFIFRNNICYNNLEYKRSNNFDLAYQSGLEDVEFTDNYSVGYNAIKYNIPVDNLRAYNNTFVGRVENIAASQISKDSNAIFSAAALPTENVMFVRPNIYEQGRSHISIFNWENKKYISVKTEFLNLNEGEEYIIHDVQHLSGAPILKFIYQSNLKEIELPLDLQSVDTVIGINVPRKALHTDNLFNVFLVQPTYANIIKTKKAEEKVEFLYYDSKGKEIILKNRSIVKNDFVRLINLQGKSIDFTFNEEASRIKLSANIVNGLYILQIRKEKELINLRFMVNN